MHFFLYVLARNLFFLAIKHNFCFVSNARSEETRVLTDGPLPLLRANSFYINTSITNQLNRSIDQ